MRELYEQPERFWPDRWAVRSRFASRKRQPPLPFPRGAVGFALCADAFMYIWTKRQLVGEMERLVDFTPREVLAEIAHRIAPLGWHVVIYFEAADLPELWDFFTTLPTAVVVGPPSERYDLVSTQITTVDIRADGWMNDLVVAPAATLRQPPPDQRLRPAGVVVVRGVQQVDPGIDGVVQDREALGLVREPAEVHAAEAQGADGKAGPAELAVFHRGLLAL